MTTAKPYILVVDDSSDGREMLAQYLTFRGFFVVEAANGETAIDLVHKRRPAVILMDLQMPGIGGWDVALDQLNQIQSQTGNGKRSAAT